MHTGMYQYTGIELRRHLREMGYERELRAIIHELAIASKYVNHAIRTGDLGLSGGINIFGERQLTLDVLIDSIYIYRLDKSGFVAKIASEERKDIYTCENWKNCKYSVAIDPLDGSSLVDVNFAVGTIASIWKGYDFSVRGREIIGAVYFLYGPRVTMVYSMGKGVFEFTLNGVMEYILTEPCLKIEGDGKIYSCGGLRKDYPEKVERFTRELESRGYKLRYSGGLVPDINHILKKGYGIFYYPMLKSRPQGKLRLLFELFPMAYLIEHANGRASSGTGDILDLKVETLTETSPVFIGGASEVELAEDIIKN